MEKKNLIINIGSASKKYALYFGRKEKFSMCFKKDELEDSAFTSAIRDFLDIVQNKNILKDTTEIDTISVRVVAPGSFFRLDRIIDAEYIGNLKKAEEKAPLHLRPLIDEIEYLKKLLPNTPLVGISDSAFHATLPPNASYYNIPVGDTKELDMYRFGYHGLAFASALRKIKKDYNPLPKRIVMVHLGGGSSITAVKGGVSVETSMGFTPLEGLPMATRVGNIDAGALMYLMKEKGLNLEELNEYLNSQSGLLGLSGKTASMKELLELEQSGNTNAKFALEIFVHQIKKYIGAYAAVLGGVDMIVFSGTISERSSHLCSQITEGFEYLGTLDTVVVEINEFEEIVLKTEKLID